VEKAQVRKAGRDAELGAIPQIVDDSISNIQSGRAVEVAVISIK